MPGPSLENTLKKNAHCLQTQTPETMKSSVWPRQNHSFYHPNFPATCREMWSHGSLIWDTLGTKIWKKVSKQTSKKSWKTIYPKTQKSRENGILLFGFWGTFFKVLRTRIPLGHQSPKKYEKITKMSPTGHQNDSQNQTHATEFQQNSD